MKKKYRSWTAEQKLAILKEIDVDGIVAVSRRHSIDAKQLYDWMAKYEALGFDGLRSRVKADPEMRRLRTENALLRRMLEERELAIQIKDELLKKSSSAPGSES
jgi:transposase-like protein